MGVLHLNFSQEIGKPDWGFSWVFSTIPGKCHDHILNRPRLIPSKSIPFHYPIVLTALSAITLQLQQCTAHGKCIHEYEEWRLLGCYAMWLLCSMRGVLVIASIVPSSPILVTLMEALSSPEMSVPTRAARSNSPEDAILHSHRRENLKSYTWVTPEHTLK
jgi:hypothetical protein